MNLIFDFGNVIIEWDKDKILNKIFKEKCAKNKIDDTIFLSNLWSEMDAGDYSIEYVENLANKQTNNIYSNEIHELMWNWNKYVNVHDEVISQIRRLHSIGYKIYILSNTARLFHKIFNEIFPDNELFISGKVLSYSVKQAKPDFAIYETLINKYSLDPKESYFFDDLNQNIETAKTLGINTYQVKDIGLFVKYLKENFLPLN